jgi:predicted glycoside hydrolase/deacetylase ChbG (UPF0249 family)
MQTEVLFIADDLGMSESINHSILESHKKGSLHGASLMMGQSATNEGIVLAKKNSVLKIGRHLHFCDSQPLTCKKLAVGEFAS